MSPPLPDRAAEPRLTSYEDVRAQFAIHVPERFNPVIGIVEAWAAEDPDAVALVSLGPEGELVAQQTAADLARESRRAARALLDAGVAHGDRVLVMLPRTPAWYAAMLGTMRIGAVAAPAPNQLTPRDIGYRLSRSGAVAAITDAQGAAKVDQVAGADLAALRLRIVDGVEPPAGWLGLSEAMDAAGDGAVPEDPTGRDDPLVVFFTSGTVSYAKMVSQTQGYGLGHVPTARFWHDVRPGDRHWTVSDTGWAKAAWGGLFGQWHERATVVQVALGRPVADTILSIIAKGAVTSFCAPPTLYRLLVQADLAAHDLSVLRHCTSAGEPLNPEVIRAWREGTGGLTIYDGYGQSETTLVVANYRTVPVRPGSMGKPVPGWDLDVVDDEGRPAPDDVVANIAVRTDPRPVGPSAATSATRRPPRRRSAAAGTTPATRRGAIATATSGSRGAATTSSPRRRTGSGPSRWSRRSSSTRRSWRPPSSGRPIPHAPRSWPRSSCWRPTNKRARISRRSCSGTRASSPLRTSTRARSTTSTSCRRRSAARFAAPSCASGSPAATDEP